MSALEARSAEPMETAWHELDAGSVLQRLRTTEHGLEPADAAARLLVHGRNELQQGRQIRPLEILRGQFGSLIIWILIGAAVLSGFLREWIDCAVILAIVVLNAAIGFVQEYHAESSLAALRKMTSPHARVRRGGAARLVSAAEVVPGDLVELEPGDIVPADARLMNAAELKTNEAALTGESAPVDKVARPLPAPTPLAERRNMLFMGTSVAAGSALAVVVATARNTELGRISQLLEGAGEQQTPLQKRLEVFGRILVWACFVVVALVFVLGLLREEPLLGLVLTSVSLAVAAVPEGLPAVVTIALAVGVQRMARRRALIRRLHAVETLGSTSVICTDKTGTLTVGEMTVRELATASAAYRVTGEGYAPVGAIEGVSETDDGSALQRLVTALAGCNGARLVQEGAGWSVIGDPTEGALLTVAAKAALPIELIEKQLPELRRFPFDSERKRMSVLRRRGDGRVLALAKGAPDVLLERCTSVLEHGRVVPLDGARREQIQSLNVTLASRGLRVLAAAERELAADDVADAEDLERDLVFLGLVGMQDPPRPEAARAVDLCKKAGIRVTMITGDQPATALAIARDLGIAGSAEEVVPGAELDRLSDEELVRLSPAIGVYARVTAAHKLRIVRAHQAGGAIVAMTGDGVNDAPAIKGADIGIAMGKAGTEVTKEASDMVITDDNFATIVAAVEEGRGVYTNIKKTLQYLLAGNSGELLLVAACVTAGLPQPLHAVHLLWINLVTDGLPALCLATDPIDSEVMQRPPRGREESITDRSFLSMMLITGCLTAGVTLAVYIATLRGGSDPEMARAHAFSTLVFAELLRSFGCRSDTKLVTEVGLTTNLRLFVVVIASFALQLAVPHLPWLARVLKMPAMPFPHCLELAAIGALPLVVLELRKIVVRRR